MTNKKKTNWARHAAVGIGLTLGTILALIAVMNLYVWFK